jgi:multiple sugar transport system permease protein
MAEVSIARPSSARREWRSPQGRREALWALFFLAPSLLGFLVFYWLPILAGLLLGFFEWDLLSDPEWAGTANFQRLFTDTGLRQALLNTLYFTIVTVPVGMVMALIIALALNQRMRGTKWYRTAYFMPVVATVVASALVWKWMFLPVYGLINNILAFLHLPQPQWLSSPEWAMPAIIIFSIWLRLGYNIVLFLAGLQAIPRDLYEAASVDGASSWAQFWHVTLPLLSPTTFLILILSLISSFQVFDQVLVMTGQSQPGGPRGAAITMVFYIYTNAFRLSRMGYASAVAMVLFLIIFVITIVQLRLQRRWVYYD